MRAVLLVSFAVLMFGFPVFAQKSTSNTLLWKISGHGLKKPSYLYGVYHDPDPEVFKMGDAVYQALDAADGISLEVSYDSLAYQLLGYLFNKQEQLLLKNAALPYPELQRLLQDSMFKIVASTSAIGYQELPVIMHNGPYPVFEQTGYGLHPDAPQMEITLDAFLYGLAQRQHKWANAIEQPEDQVSLMDEFGKFNRVTYVTTPYMKLHPEDLKQLYLDENLNKIGELLDSSASDRFIQIVIMKRNFQMAAKLEEMMRQRSMFFGIGVSHLPGEGGLIDILRKRGYTLEAIHSSGKQDPGKYRMALDNKEWEAPFQLPTGPRVQTPVPVVGFNIVGGIMKTYAAYDLSTEIFYSISATSKESVAGEGLEKTMTELMSNMNALNLGPPLKMTKPGRGLEQHFKFERFEGTLRLFEAGDLVYYMVCTGNPSAVLDTATRKFFKSFQVAEAPAELAHAMPLVDTTLGFSVMVSEKPLNQTTQEANGTRTITYNVADLVSGHMFLFIVKDGNWGLNPDSVKLQQVSLLFGNLMRDMRIQNFTTSEGYTASRIIGYFQENNTYTRIDHIVRGSRIYLVGEVIPEGYDTVIAHPVYDGFQLKPWKIPVLREFRHNGMRYYGIAQAQQDPALGSEMFKIQDFDAGMFYLIHRERLTEDFWKDKKEEQALASICSSLAGTYDVLDASSQSNGKLPAYEIVSGMQGSSDVMVTRVIRDGNDLIVLKGCYLLDQLNNPGFRRFFTSFRIDHDVK